jgi:hypothetical protein
MVFVPLGAAQPHLADTVLMASRASRNPHVASLVKAMVLLVMV